VKVTIKPSNDYSIVDQLKKNPALISILELLKLSIAHKEILEKALAETSMPNNINID
jgi:hypothetical protein